MMVEPLPEAVIPRPPSPLPQDAELEAQGRMLRGLAGHLVADPATADDAVQEAWLAALERRPDTDRPLDPWLKRVVRNTVARFKRGRVRAAQRERLVARAERAPDAAALAERGRLLRTLLDEVLTLPEAEREAVLLRYYEGAPPRDIATRLGLPVEAVYRRLEHALERLRLRLDARHGGTRQTWCLGLVAALGLPRDLLAPATAAAAGLGTGAAAGSGALSTTLTGAMLMSTTATTVTASVLTLGVGLGLGWFANSLVGPGDAPAIEREGASARPGEDLRAPSADLPRLEGSLTSKREAALSAEVKSLRDQVNALTTEKAALEKERLAGLQPFDPKALRFGLGGLTPNFDKADWTELATHVGEMAKILPRLRDDLAAGKELGPEVAQALGEHNTPLAIFAISTAKELKGTGPNGSYTHPAVIANLMRAVLLTANDPLSPAQELAIVTLGNAWAADAERVAKSVSSEAPALAATVVEVDAKQRFLESAKAQLTMSQRWLLFHPDTEGRLGLDLFSPALVYMLHTDAGSLQAEALPAKVIASLIGGAGLKDVDQAAYLDVGERWISEAPWGVEPRAVRDPDTMFPTVETMQAFARAQVVAIARVLERGQLSAEQAAKLRKLSTVITPYVVKPM